MVNKRFSNKLIGAALGGLVKAGAGAAKKGAGVAKKVGGSVAGGLTGIRDARQETIEKRAEEQSRL